MLTASLGSPVVLSAAVSSAAASPQVSGSVQFVDTSTKAVLGASQLDAGKAALTLPAATVAAVIAHPIQAVYSGDATFAPSTSGLFGIPFLINAASGDAASFAAGEFVSLLGYQLADANAPSGVSILVADAAGVTRPAILSYVSPPQINLVLPAALATGAGSVALMRGSVKVFTLPITISAIAPGLFSADASGRGQAAAQIIRVAEDGTQTTEDARGPISLGTGPSYLVLYGTGLRNRSSAENVTCVINGQSLAVTYAGAQGDFSGLDQVDVLLPQNLAGAGTVGVSVIVDGKASNQLTLTFR
jgi:uncharacterized protein (TIGR03437 family)